VKKIVVLTLVFALAVSLCSCEKKDDRRTADNDGFLNNALNGDKTSQSDESIDENAVTGEETTTTFLEPEESSREHPEQTTAAITATAPPATTTSGETTTAPITSPPAETTTSPITTTPPPSTTTAASPLVNPSPDIRNLNWGMTVNEVKKYESAKLVDEITQWNENEACNETMLTYSGIDYLGYKCNLTLCVCETKGLVGVNYCYDTSDYLAIGKSVKKSLTDQYGEPNMNYSDEYSGIYTWNRVSYNNSQLIIIFTCFDVLCQLSYFPLT